MGGLSAAAILESLNPKYAEVQEVAEDDPRLKTEFIDYPSPQGSGTMKGYLGRLADSCGNLPGVLVIKLGDGAFTKRNVSCNPAKV